ncbi:hypothetical protein [Nitratireductor sp. StC3]|uniref:hypothetical protein n=1 Tax=Nitratireductor sp. StC3 TaxID=2126741 RepID=UPI000D0DB53F|nr:hypothetical protein [Nitratireductor sp. StC3]PSM19845.1 hypothetical protein C7T96_01880 [Nitratireductor sp. StC3]
MVILILIGLVFAGVGAAWASSKNLSPFLWGLLCFFTGFIGLIILAFRKPAIAPVRPGESA